jgi:hypothetical protein
MKSYEVPACFALLSVSLLAGCAGTSSIGSGGGGEAGAALGMGGSDPAAEGGAGGVGAASSGEECKVDIDCLGKGELCKPCADGGFACSSYCSAGKCLATPGTCPAKCNSDSQCTVHDKSCIDCADGQQRCPQSTCQMGVCQTSKPVCAPDLCQTAMDCGAPPPNCVPCTDGSCAIYDCLGKQCALTCPKSSLGCQTADDCRALSDGPCTLCLNDKCAVPACLDNACQLVCPIP